MTVKKLSEHEIQVYLCNYLKKNNIQHFAVPNGVIFNKDRVQAARYVKYLRSEGVKKGVSDMVLLFGKGQVAFLELKTDIGRPSKEQVEWNNWLKNNGYESRICKGLKECIDYVDYLIDKCK